MVYLFESELPKNKSIFVSLIKVYGLGNFKSSQICKKLGFSKFLKVKNLTKEQINKLAKIFELENIKTSSDLKKLKLLNNNKLIEIKSYRGLRKSRGLPVRGQRTHTNAKTAKKRIN